MTHKFKKNDLVRADISATSDPVFVNAIVLQNNESTLRVREVNTDDEWTLECSRIDKMPKMFDVKILKCPHSLHWYNNQIGNTFSVKNSKNKKWFELVTGGENDGWLIERQDCVKL